MWHPGSATAVDPRPVIARATPMTVPTPIPGRFRRPDRDDENARLVVVRDVFDEDSFDTEQSSPQPCIAHAVFCSSVSSLLTVRNLDGKRRALAKPGIHPRICQESRKCNTMRSP